MYMLAIGSISYKDRKTKQISHNLHLMKTNFSEKLPDEYTNLGCN